MNNLLAVDFSTGLAAVLLGAAAIILIVMIAEAICMARPRKVKSKGAKPQSEEQPAVDPTDEQPPQEQLPADEPANSEEQEPNGQPPRQEPPERAEEGPLPVPEPEEKPRLEEPPQKAEKPRGAKATVKRKGGKGAYDKSFTARIILSDGEVKSYYSGLKNELLKRGFQSRVCWRYESFRAVKKLGARLAMRGGGLCIFCALNPDDYINSAAEVEDLSDRKTYKNTPLLCLVKSDSGEQLSKELIAGLAQKFCVENADFEERDFAATLPFEDEEILLEKGLIKVRPRGNKTKRNKPEKKVETEAKPEVKKEVKTAVKTPQIISKKTFKKTVKKCVKKVVNLKEIFNRFCEGETADFEEIKNRIFGGQKSITYIKILGSGKADKNITVIANSFSRAAEKNILEAGGKVIRKKS